MLEAVGAAVEAAAASEQSHALFFCGPSNKETIRTHMATFQQLTRRAKPNLVQRLEGARVILEAISGLWVEAPRAFLPFSCTLRLHPASNKVQTLQFQNLAPSEIYFKIQSAVDCPLALLILQSGDAGLFSEIGLERVHKGQLPKVPLLELEERECFQNHIQQFRSALGHLGASEDDTVELLSSVAATCMLDPNQDTTVRAARFATFNNILQILQRAFKDDSVSPDSKTVTMLAVPVPEGNDYGAFCVRHLADSMLLSAHSADIKLVPNDEEVLKAERALDNCVWNALHDEHLNPIVRWLKSAQGGGTTYEHYSTKIDYLDLQPAHSQDYRIHETKTINDFLRTQYVNAIYIHVGNSIRNQDAASNVRCFSADCTLCKSRQKVEASFLKIVKDLQKKFESDLGKENQAKIEKLVHDSVIAKKSLVEIIEQNFDDDLISSELFRLHFIPSLLQRWEEEALEVCQKSTASELYRLVHDLHKFVDFEKKQIPKQILSVSEACLQHRRWMFSKPTFDAVRRFKDKANALLQKLPPKVIKAELELITQFKHHLRTLKPSKFPQLQTCNEKTYAQLRDMIQEVSPIKWPLEDNFHLLDLLKETIARFLQPPQLQERKNRKILEVRGSFIEMRLVMPSIIEKIKESSLHEVRFLAKEAIHFDASLDSSEWTGIDIFMRTMEFNVDGTQKIDVSGKINILDYPSAGAAPDGTGLEGKAGYAGKDGGNVTIDAIIIHNGTGLSIISNGGNGGRGQDGGRGRNGENGVGLEPKRMRKLYDTHVKTKCDPYDQLKKMKKIVHIGSYLEVEDEATGLRMIFNYDRSKLMNTSTFFVCFGTAGTIGKSGGFGGPGGEGGRPGTITVPSTDIKICANKGADGADGAVGQHGAPGRNGWDIGYNDRAFWNKALYYGLAKNKKLQIVRHATEGPRRSKCKHLECYIEITSEVFPTPLQSYLLGVNMARNALQEEQATSTLTSVDMKTLSVKTKKQKKVANKSATLRRLLVKSKSMPGTELTLLSQVKKVNSEHQETPRDRLRKRMLKAFHDYHKQVREMNAIEMKHFCLIGQTHKRSDFNNHCLKMLENKVYRLEALKIVAAEMEKNDSIQYDLQDKFEPYKEGVKKLRGEIVAMFEKFQGDIKSSQTLHELWVKINRDKRESVIDESKLMENIEYKNFLQVLGNSSSEKILPDDLFFSTLINYMRLMNTSVESFIKVATAMPPEIWDSVSRLSFDENSVNVLLKTKKTNVPHKIVSCFGTKNRPFCILDTGNVCSLHYHQEHHRLVSKRYIESVLKGLLLSYASRTEEDTTGEIDPKKLFGKPKKFGMKCQCLQQDKKLLLRDFKKSHLIVLIEGYLKILSANHFNQFCFLHIMAERLHFEQTYALSAEELVFVLDFIVTSFSNATADLLLIQWILLVCDVKDWIRQLTILHLETDLKLPIDSESDLIKNVENITRYDVLIHFNEYLRNETFNGGFDIKLTETIFALLAQTNEESVDLAQLSLVEWPNVLKISSLRASLRAYVEGIDLDEGVSSMIIIEHKFGSGNAKHVLERLKSIKLPVCEFLRDILTEKEPIHIKENAHEERSCTIDASVLQIMEAVTTFECSINNIDSKMRMIEALLRSASAKESEYKNLTLMKMKTIIKRMRKELNVENVNSLISALELIDWKIELVRGYRLRNTQKVAALLMLLNEKGTVLQVATGEGKSLIVAVVAIMKVLMGQRVDIITSSPVLARRDAEAMTNLYAIFEISVSHNCHENVEERRSAYENCDIIYGEISGFQRDFLLDRFYNKDILRSRNFEEQTVIVDEVDSMLLDKGNNMLYLSHEISGFDKLQAVYIFIWKRINRYDLNVVEQAKKTKAELLHDLFGLIREGDIRTMDKAMTTADAKDILATLASLKIIDQNGKLLINNVDSTLHERLSKRIGEEKQKLVPRLIFLINGILNRIPEISIPQYFYPFVELHVESWIESAVNALYMIEKQDYIVDVDRTGTRVGPRIVILDRDTGTDLTNSQWDEALHQFLQLKHGLHLSSQTLKAVFVSNTSFLKKYSALCGLTGTLGSMREKQLLKEVYDIDYATLPPNRRKRFRLLEPKLLRTKESWVAEIKKEVRMVLQQNRSILIICETVEDVNALNKELKGNEATNVFTYTRDYEEFVFADGKNQLPSGNIILSTNLAGRGTDVILSEQLSKDGGLHVCVSYLAPNDRVEQQALGRAARCGEPGSGRIICCAEDADDENFHSLVVRRVVNEIRRISEIKQFYETQIELEEQCLDKFQKVYEAVRNKECTDIFKRLISQTASNLSGSGVIEKVFVATDKQSTNIKDEVYNVLQRQCLDDWAFWLDARGKKIAEANIGSKKSAILEDLDLFLEETKNKDWKSMVQHNPWACVKFIKLLAQSWISDVAFDLAEIVVDKERNFSYSARYYLAFLALNPTASGMDVKQIARLEQHLVASRELLMEQKRSIDVNTLHVTHQKKEVEGLITLAAYEEQQAQIKSVYDSFLSSIEQMLGRQIQCNDFIPKFDENQTVDIKLIPKLVEALTNATIIEPISINAHLNTDVIERIATERGIAAGKIREILEKFKTTKKFSQKDILHEFTNVLKMPGKEQFWRCLSEANVMNNEKEVVTITKVELRSFDMSTYEILENGMLNGTVPRFCESGVFKNLPKGRFLLRLYDWDENEDSEEEFRIELSILLKAIGKEEVEALETVGLLNTNKIAEVEIDKYKSMVFPDYDTLDTANFEAIKVSGQEIFALVEYLENTSVLVRRGTTYHLNIHNSEIEKLTLEPFPIYKYAVKSALELSFAFRIAAEKILEDVGTKEGKSVSLPLPEKLEQTLYDALVDSNQIKPQAVTRKVLSAKKVGQVVNKVMKSKETESICSYIYEYLVKCQSAFIKDKTLNPAIRSVSEYLVNTTDFEVVTQFEANNEGEVIEWSESAKKQYLTRLLDMETLMSIGKVLYVGQKLLEKVSDDKSGKNEKHDELFRIKIHDKFDAFFDNKMVIIINKLSFVLRFLLAWFFPRAYLATKFGLGCIQSGMLHALDWIAKVHDQHTITQKTQYVDLIRLGAYERNVKGKMEAFQLNIYQSSAYDAIDRKLKTFTESLTTRLIERSRIAAKKSNLDIVDTEWFDLYVADALEPLLDRIFNSVRFDIDTNISTRRNKRSWKTADGIAEMFLWSEEEDYLEIAEDIFERLFQCKSTLNQIDGVREWQKAFEMRLRVMIAEHVTNPLGERIRPKLREAARRALSGAAETEAEIPKRPTSMVIPRNEYLERQRNRFEWNVWTLLQEVCEPSILSFAIQEEVPMRGEWLVGLLPLVENYLGNDIVLRNKTDERAIIPGSITVYLDIKREDFCTFVSTHGKPSIFSEVADQTDIQRSLQDFKDEFSNYVTRDENTKRLLKSIPKHVRKPFSPCPSKDLITEVSKHIAPLCDVMRGRRIHYDVDVPAADKKVDLVRRFSPESLDRAFKVVLMEAVSLLQEVCSSVGVLLQLDSLMDQVEESMEAVNFDLLTLDQKVECLEPGIYAVEKAVQITLHVNKTKRYRLELRLNIDSELNACFHLLESTEDDNLAGQLHLNKSDGGSDGTPQPLPSEAKKLLRSGKMLISKAAELKVNNTAQIMPVLLPPIVTKKKSVARYSFDAAEDSC